MKTTKMLVCGGVFFLVTSPCLAGAGPRLNASPSRQNAAAQDLGTQKITIDLTGADLHSVVSSLMRQVPGLNLMLKDGDLAYKPVYLRLTDAPIETVLHDVALYSGAELTRNDDGSFFLHPPTPVPSPVTVASALTPMAAAPAVPVSTIPAPAPAGFAWHKLVLRHAIPSEILAMLGWAGSAPAVNPFDRVRLSPSNSNTVTSSSGVASPSSAVTPAVSVAVPIASGAGSLTTSQANRSAELLGPDQAQQFPGQQYGGNPFSGGQNNFSGGNQPPFAPGGRGGPNGGGNLPEGVSKIYALEADNSLLLLATPDGFTQVSQLVKMLDILPRQVQIKVEFVTASVNDVDAFGADISYAPFFSTNQGDSANLANTPQTSVTLG